MKDRPPALFDLGPRSPAEEARVRPMTDPGAGAILTLDESGTIESANPASERLFGYSSDEMLGQSVAHLIPGMLSGEASSGEALGRRKDGTEFALHLALSELPREGRRRFVAVARDISELRDAIQRLQDSEARTRAILETAVDAVITIDERGTIESLNPAAERLFGYARAELLGRNVKMLMPQPYQGEHDAYLRNYLITGRKKIIGIGREVLGLKKDGSTFPMDLAVSEFALSGRRYFAGIVRDVSTRKEDEAALRRAIQQIEETEARTGAIFQTAVDAIITIDERGLIESVNPAAERMFGYAPGELAGKSVSVLAPEPQRSEHDGYVAKYHATGRKNIIGIGREVLGCRKDGTTFPLHLAVSEFRVGARRMYTGVARDITETKAAIEALRDSETRARTLLETAVDAIITIDERGAIESVNSAAEQMFGYRQSELVGKNVNMLMPEPYQAEHDGYIRNYLATGHRKIIGIGREVRGLRKDGSTFPMDLAVSEVRLGRRRLFTGILRDITGRKEAEAKLKYFAETLQRRNEELVRSNQELDDFAYIASHDLKEPLRGISNYSAFMLEDYGEHLDEDGRAKLETLKRLSQRMETLINTLLQFSRVGRVDLAMKDTDLNQLVAEVLDALHIALEERRVEVRIPRRLPVVRCDGVRMREVFHNLITNAIKYNDNPQKWIEIAQEPPGTFYVRDNGIGMRDKHLEAIFRIFKRLHGREQYGGGTGVGLTFVKKIVERHGGRVWVESTPGEGSTFYFTLNSGKTNHDR